MPADIQKLMQNKEAILNVIVSKGPSLPVQVARQVNLSLLFASAYLSELYNERKVKMSNMKVGSSPLYYMLGQEAMLENFIQYLNHKEREAFTMLKSQKLLEDDKMGPAIRVALRAIKDFAIPIKIKVNEDSKLFWKFFLIQDEEIKSIAQAMYALKKEVEEKEKQVTLVKKPEEVAPEKEIAVEDKPHISHKHKAEPMTEQKEESKEDVMQAKQGAEKISEELPPLHLEKTKKIKKKKVPEESKFARNVKNYLSSKNIEVLSIIDEKKNHIVAKIRLDTQFGKQEFYFVAKDKKKVSEEDLIIALQKSQEEKMPLLLMAPGEIDKKASEYAKTWRNLIIYEKLSF